MPAQIITPDPDSLIAESPAGIRAYALDFDPRNPLYRRVKLIAPAPGMIAPTRRTVRLTWMAHEGRFARGGPGWIIEKDFPKVYTWLAEECAASFTPQYVVDMTGWSMEEYADAVAADKAARGK